MQRLHLCPLVANYLSTKFQEMNHELYLYIEFYRICLLKVLLHFHMPTIFDQALQGDI
nr:MAG TPA: hypothetical protein [Caudoviricetes sp.]